MVQRCHGQAGTPAKADHAEPSVTRRPEGNAVLYCEGAFGTTNGKTAHGLVRRSRRYRIVSVVDSKLAGRDAGEVLDGRPSGVPILPSVTAAIARARSAGEPATHLVIGLAPDGGHLPVAARADLELAIAAGLHVVSGLHDFVSEDAGLVALAARNGVTLLDVRKPPARHALHFFSGKIAEVTSRKVAILGTDSAVGKRTTAWLLVDALNRAGHSAELVGTGQTAWLQGVRHGIVLDALVNDFVSGEIEHAIWSAWNDSRPAVIVIEGQGSLLNPAYPGGFEILAAGRPDAVVLQHAPNRLHYDGFPDCPMQPIKRQIEAIEIISSRPVIAITISREGLSPEAMARAKASLREETGLPVCDVLSDGAGAVVDALRAQHGCR